MTVTDLIANFRAGLLGLLPAVERVEMPWHPSEAYDEWDDLALAVYEALVVWPLRWTLPENEHQYFPVPKYDLMRPEYAGLSLIEVLPPTASGAIRVFHALGTTEAPFDTVVWRPVSPTGTPLSDVLETSTLEGARFVLRVYHNGFPASHIEKVALPSDHP